VIAPWTIGGLLRDLTARGSHPAVITFSDDGVVTWDSKALVEQVLGSARNLREAGVGSGVAVALWAPNSPLWIVAALGVLASGGMLVPIDDLADAEQLEAALISSRARLILTTVCHRDASGASLRTHNVTVLLIDEVGCRGPDATARQSSADKKAEDLPAPAADAPAMLSWTSGTTGSPKAFVLTQCNIASNVNALQQLAVVGPRDRVLLPLPLHHAYPFVVGVLTTLTLGTTIVLPGGTTGPALTRALREANVTTIIVPRLYEALSAAITARLDSRHLILRLAFRAPLRLAPLVRQSTGLHLGCVLFASVRHTMAPRLRLLVSGERPRKGWKRSAGWCSRDMGWRKPPRCLPAIARKTAVSAAPGARSPAARFGLRA
jgi:long-chain acyl-CoA synthetase